MQLAHLRQSSLPSLRQRHGLRVVLALLCVLWGSLALFGQDTEPTYGLPQQLTSEARVSFLASDPHGEASYTLYGHAGLRVQDARLGLDVTFNYGLFDFSDDFSWRFTQGKTDYLVAPMATADYFAEYLSHGAVHEVGLRTDSLQRVRLWTALLENIQPAHRTYRYDAFRNNCSTRPLDLYFASLRPDGASPSGGDTLVLVERNPAVDYVLEPQTWRAVINRLEASSPWLVLGTDLAMGTQLDARLSLRERFFIPTDAATLLPQLRYGQVDADGKKLWINPVEYTETYGESRPITGHDLWITHPLCVFSLLLLGTILWTYARMRGRRLPYLWEGLVFTAAGLTGALLFFLVFISEHPMITTNWNLLVLHPFYLLFPVLRLFGQRASTARRYLHYICAAALLLFPLISRLAGQEVNTSVYLIAVLLYVIQLPELRRVQCLSSRSHAPQED